MAYNFSHLKQKAIDIQNHLKEEFPVFVQVEQHRRFWIALWLRSYGTKSPINQVAGINMEDARTLRITPYDASQLTEVEKAITNSNLGVSVSVDARGIRIFSRSLLQKYADFDKTYERKLEKAKVSLRAERDNAWNDIQKKKKEKKSVRTRNLD